VIANAHSTDHAIGLCSGAGDLDGGGHGVDHPHADEPCARAGRPRMSRRGRLRPARRPAPPAFRPAAAGRREKVLRYK
jgi:hypothetical protein